ncbi:hypothetical protein SDC9_208517 [bioreactor metagenome]|uniref:Uncharacterized protein n=1 Tax=bioreactor metagenome TaxID=1076179 RepID=A0A645JAT6_9ZZZZ
MVDLLFAGHAIASSVHRGQRCALILPLLAGLGQRIGAVMLQVCRHPGLGGDLIAILTILDRSHRIAHVDQRISCTLRRKVTIPHRSMLD